jgi:DNA/RNA-binding domain of Phe-tRNA-synthetase-like protein
MTLTLARALAAIVRPGAVGLEGLTIVEADRRLDAPLLEAERQARANPPPERAAVRAMYRAVGLDPTKRRPSSEALLRRGARGEPLPRVNTAVDVCNWCSLELQLPYGLYDADQVAGDIELRLGAPGEQYAGIRKDVVHVEGRLTLADRLGPFGNPSSDSARTMVTPSATRVLAVIFAPSQIPPDVLGRALDLTASRIARYTGGRETLRLVV